MLMPHKTSSVHLLGSRTVEEAAQKSKVGERTLRIWLRDDCEFRAEFRAAQSELMEGACKLLIERSLQLPKVYIFRWLICCWHWLWCISWSSLSSSSVCGDMRSGNSSTSAILRSIILFGNEKKSCKKNLSNLDF